MKPDPSPEAGARDWSEDFSHENGNYECICAVCGQHFMGHKRRKECRACAHSPEAGALEIDGLSIHPANQDTARLRQIAEQVRDPRYPYAGPFWYAEVALWAAETIDRRTPLSARTEDVAGLVESNRRMLASTEVNPRSHLEYNLRETTDALAAMQSEHRALSLEIGHLRGRAEAAERERDAALAEVERLREALKPFAALASEIERCARQCDGPASDPTNWAMSCEWRDLICARAALSPTDQGDGDEK